MMMVKGYEMKVEELIVVKRKGMCIVGEEEW
jgi:hypothetical protein